MNWRPASEYTGEMGVVIVWLQWLHYERGAMGHDGQFDKAYRMPLNDGAVWVDAANCTPIETTGRRVTHFMQPTSPSTSLAGTK